VTALFVKYEKCTDFVGGGSLVLAVVSSLLLLFLLEQVTASELLTRSSSSSSIASIARAHFDKDKEGPAVPAHNAQRVVQVERVDVGAPVPTERPPKGVALLVISVGTTDRMLQAFQQLGGDLVCRALLQTATVMLLLKKAVPAVYVGRSIVGLHAAGRDPDRVPVGCTRIGHGVTMRGENAAAGAGWCSCCITVATIIAPIGGQVRGRFERKGAEAIVGAKRRLGFVR